MTAVLASARPAADPAEPASDRARRAGVAMTEGRFEEAIAIWGELVRAEPRNLALRLNLGLALHGAERYREAASQLERVLEAHPGFPAATLVLGICYNRLHLPRQAIPILESSLQKEPRNEDIQRELAAAYREDGQYIRAAEMLRVLVPRDRANPRPCQELLLCYIALRRQAGTAMEREGTLPSIEEKLPADDCTGEAPACRFARGELWSLARESSIPARWRHRALDQLIRDGVRDLEEIPSPDTNELLAEVYDSLGRHKEAVDQWRAALELAPRNDRLRKALENSLLRVKEGR